MRQSVTTIPLENSMLFWNKVWEKIRKYWQVFIGLFVGLGFAIKYWWQLRGQKKVLQKEIEATKKKKQVEKDFVSAVRSAEESAQKKHEANVKEVKANDQLEKDKINKELEDRVKENNNGTNSDLASKIGESFGVDVVLPGDKNNE